MSVFRLVYTKLVFLGHKKNSQSYGKKKKRRRAQRWCHAYALVFPSSRPSCRVVYHTLEEKFKMMQNTYSLNIDIIQLKKVLFPIIRPFKNAGSTFFLHYFLYCPAQCMRSCCCYGSHTASTDKMHEKILRNSSQNLVFDDSSF